MHRLFSRLVIVTVSLSSGFAPITPEPSSAPKLLLAFASTRERRDPPYPKIYFYEHDGIGKGKLIGSIGSVTGGVNKTRADMHPSLSRDGRLCAFCSQFGVLDGGRVEIWDRKENKLLGLPSIQESPKIHQMGATLAGDGKLVGYTAWARPGSSQRWGVFLYDVGNKKTLTLPGLNRENFDQRMPALSQDGRFLAYASNVPGGVGSTDIYLYDLARRKVLALPEMNSKNLDIQPALNGDGRLLAFCSDRPGAGGRDIYLFDRLDRKFLPLAGLNTVAHEQSPALSPDGRYLAFVSERFGGTGERDVYLYDRKLQKLLPTPGLNSKEDDFDPCVSTNTSTQFLAIPAGGAQ